MGELEKRTYLTWHRDGLADLGVGLLVLIFGLGMKYDLVLLAPVYGCVGYPIWLLLKQWITERRLGWVAFGERRKRREQRGWTVLLMLGCGVLVLMAGAFYLVSGEDRSGMMEQLAISLIFVLLVSSVGAVLQLVRLHLYSGLILLAGVLGHILSWNPETRILLPGAIVVLSGGILLGTFIARYPAGSGGDELPGTEGSGQEQ